MPPDVTTAPPPRAREFPCAANAGPVFLRAVWRRLALFTFEVDPDFLAPLAPRGTRIDLRAGRAYASVVGFEFLEPRYHGWPAPFHGRFGEVNLRFYVERRVDGRRRAGVVFVREIVGRRLIAWTARWLHGEPFTFRKLVARTRVVGDASSDGKDLHGAAAEVQYALRARGQWQCLEVAARGPLRPPRPGSLEEHALERDWAYGPFAAPRTLEHGVERGAWRLWPVQSSRFDIDAASLYGHDWAKQLAGPPASVALVNGGPVAVRAGTVVE